MNLKMNLLIIFFISFSFVVLGQISSKAKLIFYCSSGCKGCHLAKDSLFEDEDIKQKLACFEVKNIKVSPFKAIYLYLFKGIDRVPSFVIKYKMSDGKRVNKRQLGFIPKDKFLDFLTLDGKY